MPALPEDFKQQLNKETIESKQHEPENSTDHLEQHLDSDDDKYSPLGAAIFHDTTGLTIDEIVDTELDNET